MKLHTVADLPPSSTHVNRLVDYAKETTPKLREIERIRDGKARNIEARANRQAIKKRKHKFKRRCGICKVECLSIKAYIEHLDGAKHKAKLNSLRNGPFKCNICVREFVNQGELRKHTNSFRHLKECLREQRELTKERKKREEEERKKKEEEKNKKKRSVFYTIPSSLPKKPASPVHIE